MCQIGRNHRSAVRVCVFAKVVCEKITLKSVHVNSTRTDTYRL